MAVLQGHAKLLERVAKAAALDCRAAQPTNKQIACFVTLKGDNPQKPLEKMKEAISPNISAAELGITNDVKNLEEAEKQIIDWCNAVQNSFGFGDKI